MKIRPHRFTYTLALLLALWAAGFVPCGTAHAITYNVPSGQTTVAFAPEFFNLVPALGGQVARITPARIKGNLNNQNLRAVFPITTGAVDTSWNKAQIGHKGGITLRTANNGTVQLTGFSIDFALPSDASRAMTALVVVNGALVGRVPVFNFGLNQIATAVQGGTLRVRNVPLTLTGEAATILNALFKLPGQAGGQFFEGFPVGRATVRGNNLKNLGKI